MEPDVGIIDPLFERLVEDPRSLPAFEAYARAVEAAARSPHRDVSRALAETLTGHVEKLPALAESRLQESFDRVTRELLASVEIQELRPGRALEAALERARQLLSNRFPRVRGMSPEEFVTLHRSDPQGILDFLESADVEWLHPRLLRCRAILRNCDEIPGDASLHSHLAGAMAELGTSLLGVPPPSLAEVAFRTALLYDPGEPDARAGLGVLARRFGRLQEAELEFQAALDRAPRHRQALAGLGELQVLTHRHAEASVIADRLLTAHPEEPEGHLLAGTLALAEDRPTAALPGLLEALELDPDRAETYRLLARAYAALGHGELAREYHEGLALRLGRNAELPRLPDVAPERAPLDPSLTPRCPSPPSLARREVDSQPPPEVGPLTRREAFRCLMDRCMTGGEPSRTEMGPVLQARMALRISRETFDQVYEDLLSHRRPRTREGATFDPVEYFEDLRRRAWRDGFLSPEEREILEDVLQCLGIDRRSTHRPRPD